MQRLRGPDDAPWASCHTTRKRARLDRCTYMAEMPALAWPGLLSGGYKSKCDRTCRPAAPNIWLSAAPSNCWLPLFCPFHAPRPLSAPRLLRAPRPLRPPSASRPLRPPRPLRGPRLLRSCCWMARLSDLRGRQAGRPVSSGHRHRLYYSALQPKFKSCAARAWGSLMCGQRVTHAQAHV